MEIHPPHQSIHTWRDFLTHIAIITIGLFIALTLEAGVEALHHRHIVREARENIRKELELNHKAAQRDLVLLQQNVEREEANLAAIHKLSTHPAQFSGSVSNTMDFSSPDDAAWRTARDTGALGYMPYDEVERYSGLYMLQALVNDQSVSAARHDFAAAAPLLMGYEVTQLPQPEYDRLLHDNAAVKIELMALMQMVQQYDNACLEELKKH